MLYIYRQIAFWSNITELLSFVCMYIYILVVLYNDIVF